MPFLFWFHIRFFTPHIQFYFLGAVPNHHVPHPLFFTLPSCSCLQGSSRSAGSSSPTRALKPMAPPPGGCLVADSQAGLDGGQGGGAHPAVFFQTAIMASESWIPGNGSLRGSPSKALCPTRAAPSTSPPGSPSPQPLSCRRSGRCPCEQSKFKLGCR